MSTTLLLRSIVHPPDTDRRASALRRRQRWGHRPMGAEHRTAREVQSLLAYDLQRRLL